MSNPATVKVDTRTTEFPVSSIEVIIGYQTKQGLQEVLHTVNGSDVQIASCEHKVLKKMRAAKAEDGSIVGYEPSGEEELVLRVKYFRG